MKQAGVGKNTVSVSSSTLGDLCQRSLLSDSADLAGKNPDSQGRHPIMRRLQVSVYLSACTYAHTHTCALMSVTEVCRVPVVCPYILNFKSQECLLYILVLCCNTSGGLRGRV